MSYDVVIIGAGMSGLAAGIRLAYFDKKVCIVERHEIYGGLNSFYTLDGRAFDVGLHAVTNFAPPSERRAPLNKLLRQLRLTRDDFALRPQLGSSVRFPDCTLRFNNDIQLLISQVAEHFPAQADRFLNLIEDVRSYDDTRLDPPLGSAREFIARRLTDATLADMLLCPLTFYGSATEHDMDVTQFVILFKSIFLEGMARPREGVRRIIRVLVKKYRACGGKFRMNCGVERIVHDERRVTELLVSTGETITADKVLSSAGFVETMKMCQPTLRTAQAAKPGRLSFTESISVLDTPPAQLGIDTAIIFFNDAPTYTYARPDSLVDTASGVICCPNNYEGHGDMEGTIRLTSLANYDRWVELDEEAYRQAKRRCHERIVERVVGFLPDFRSHVVYTDMFTPRTIAKFTGHLAGAVYGTPTKIRDGRTPLDNLFVCGTDQGYLGIIGALLSGVTMANMHVLDGP